MSGNNIKVVCRFRPMNRMELDARSEECVDIDGEATVCMKNSASLAGPEKDGFTFDRVFDMATRQDEIFDWGVKGIVEDVMTGFNGTLFCYGQTGSGKTYTMMGADIDNPALKGLIPRIVEQIFASIMSADISIEYTVKVSYMEIYMEKIKDLLRPQNDNLSIHEDKARGVYVKGLTDVYVGSESEVYKVMKAGGSSRATSSTNMNAESSRSHSIFVIGIHQRNVETGSQKSGNLYLVDLAGSEKVGKTGATGQTLEEAKKINKSLSALGMVINSLTDGKSTHVPYRDSKLTRILQESLGGNSRTTLIINCSPASYNEAETLSTLRFGMRAKSIKNKARVNVEMSPAELKALLKKTVAELAAVKEHTARLEEEVLQWRAGAKVEQSEWMGTLATTTGTGASRAESSRRPVFSPTGSGLTPSTPSGLSTPGRSGTPGGLLASPFQADSRPDTPTVYSLPADEKEEFLRRENELSDQLAEKETALAGQEKLVVDLRDEIAYLKEQDATTSKENQAISAELAELRILTGRLQIESRDAAITVDTYRDSMTDLQRDIDEQRAMIDELRKAERREKEEERERRKEAMLGEMMAKIDLGGSASDATGDKLRRLLTALDSSDGEKGEISAQTRDLVRSHIAESQDQARDLQERLRLSQEDGEMNRARRGEVERLLEKREAAYEELLERTGGDNSVELAEFKEQYESRYKTQEELLQSEIKSLVEQVDSRSAEMRRLQANLESYKVSNEELNRALNTAVAGSTQGESFAASAQEADRLRREMEIQHAEFEISKKSLVRDLQNRCEKVVELEMQLDEVREQYKLVVRSSNAKTHQRKLAMMVHNLEALNVVQKQLVEQNTTLKKEITTTEKRLLGRNERIQNLEQVIVNHEHKLALKEAKFEATIQNLQNQIIILETDKQRQAAYNQGRIAKPLRGGGGAISGGGGGGGIGQTPQQPLYQALASGNNALGRLQNEESGGGGKRQSWFFSQHK